VVLGVLVPLLSGGGGGWFEGVPPHGELALKKAVSK
jgi:hypothetical protein